MSNIINIVEENNILSFQDEPLDIVSGNTNYSLHFTFSEEWSGFLDKIAVFVVDGMKTTVEFQGDDCSVPAMPNANVCFIYVMAGDSAETSLISTSLKLKIIPTTDATAEADFEGFKNYLSLALEKLKQFEQGNYIAKTAEESLTQVDLTSNQTVSGNKDFVGELSYKGEDVATKNTFTNKNLLLNGEFQVNQRGNSSYTGKRDVYTYSVDRWRIFGQSSTIDAETKIVKVLKNQTFSQIIEVPENLKGKQVTACLNVDEFTKEINVFLTDGITEEIKTLEPGDNILTLTIDANAETIEFGLRGVALNASGKLNYAKLEAGGSYTGYCYESYSQDLLNCQRYYYKKMSSNDNGVLAVGSCPVKTEARVIVNLPTEMRVIPTMKFNGTMVVITATEDPITTYSIHGYDIDSVIISFDILFGAGGMGALLVKKEATANIEFDAEIY